MRKKNAVIQFGENMEGYEIPVLNEREIRAAAGILFLATFLSLMFIVFKGNFVPIKYVVTFFFADFLIRVFINPRFSPTLIMGRLMVRNQNPEYVGARQKKFAWIIGVVLSAIMFIFLVLVNAYSPITGIGCLICLVFLFFESAFGICLGCKFYPLFFKEKAQYCPGEICDTKTRQDIQKTSPAQVFIALAFIACIFLAVFILQKEFEKKPYDLFGINSATAKVRQEKPGK
ncbi:MAG: DUF4395 domain-containing protein [Chitinophagaceae bacterium]|nr:DUF4395 domain-containing protein [Chitinophagaceae bacterium]